VMEVFRFDPGAMHFTDKTASALAEQARLDLASGNVQRAGALLEQALSYDANSARIHLLLGRALMLVGKLDDAEREFGVALRLQHDLWDARFGQADVASRREKPKDAIAILEQLVEDNPQYAAGYQALAQLYYRTRLDTARAAYYLRRYNDTSAGSTETPR
jgi:tetratricopeptide (TPR) repeat protein